MPYRCLDNRRLARQAKPTRLTALRFLAGELPLKNFEQCNCFARLSDHDFLGHSLHKCRSIPPRDWKSRLLS